MTDETPSTAPKQQIPDLSGLADFQFGPAWARPGARQERPASYPERRSGDRQGGDRRPRRDNREGRQPRGERRVDGQSGERSPAPGSTETPPHHFPAGSCQGGHGFLRPL